MSIFSNPKTLYGARIWQFGFALGVLVLISYAGVHRGWWTNINGPIAVASTYHNSHNHVLYHPLQKP
jgi:hypothetical protein